MPEYEQNNQGLFLSEWAKLNRPLIQCMTQKLKTSVNSRSVSVFEHKQAVKCLKYLKMFLFLWTDHQIILLLFLNFYFWLFMKHKAVWKKNKVSCIIHAVKAHRHFRFNIIAFTIDWNYSIILMIIWIYYTVNTKKKSILSMSLSDMCLKLDQIKEKLDFDWIKHTFVMKPFWGFKAPVQ